MLVCTCGCKGWALAAYTGLKSGEYFSSDVIICLTKCHTVVFIVHNDPCRVVTAVLALLATSHLRHYDRPGT